LSDGDDFLSWQFVPVVFLVLSLNGCLARAARQAEGVVPGSGWQLANRCPAPAAHIRISKWLSPRPYWRFKLDQTNRLLALFARHGDETVCLVLEVILNPAYDRSRFLRGAALEWQKIDLNGGAKPGTPDINQQAVVPRYVHPRRGHFYVLDKVLSFDDAQQAVYEALVPLVLVGSAGSGKTALTLQKNEARAWTCAARHAVELPGAKRV